MPIYTYKCPKCGKEYEKKLPYADKDKQKCDCGTPLKTVPSGCNFRITMQYG
jgi:putative FmdB family regulatory protein